MTRWITDGNETGEPTGGSVTRSTVGTAPTLVTTPKNSGTNAWSCATTAVASNIRWTKTGVLDRTYFARAYFRVGAGPSALTRILQAIQVAAGGSNIIGSIRMTTSRTLQLFDVNGLQVGSTSAALAVDTQHEVDLGIRVNTSGQGQLAMRVNGTVVVAFTAADVGNFAIDRWEAGKATASTITNLYLDDFAVNDDQGATDNSWPAAAGATLVTPSWASPTPANASTVSGSVDINVTTTDDTAVAKVEFFNGASLLDLQETTPYQWTWDTTQTTDGSMTMTAKVTQNDSQTVSITRDFTVDNAVSLLVDKIPTVKIKVGASWVVKPVKFFGPPPPVTLEWVEPASGATVTGTTAVTVNTSDDSAVAKIEFFNNANNGLLATEAIAPYSWVWDPTSLPNGSFTMKAKATLHDASTVEITRTFTINISAPPPPSGDALPYSPPTLVAPITVTIPTGFSRTVNLAAGQDYILVSPNPVSGGLKVNGGRNIIWRGGHVRMDFVGGYSNFGGSASAWRQARRAPEFGGFSGTVFVEGLRIDGGDACEGIIALSSSAGSKFILQNFYIALSTRAIVRWLSASSQALAPTWPTSFSVGASTYDGLVAQSSGKFWDEHGDAFQSWNMPTEIKLARGTIYTPCQMNFCEGPKSGGSVIFKDIDCHPMLFQSKTWTGGNVINKGNSGNPDYSMVLDNFWQERSTGATAGASSDYGSTKANYTATYSGSSAWEASLKLIGVDSGYPGSFVAPTDVGIGYVSPGYV